jgi:hypothetical protein
VGPPTPTRTWITQLRNKLRAQPARYPTEEACLRYAFSRLEGGALDSVRHYLSEETGDVALASLSDLLTILRQNFDNPNRVATALAEIKSLKQGTGSFMTYLASFRRWMADLPDVGEEAMKVWLWDGLSSQLKDALAARETDCRRQPLSVMIDQPARYPTEEACLRYAFSRLEGGALDSVRHYLSEETGDVALGSLADLLTILRQNFDNPNRVATALAEIKSLRQATGSFMTYLASFRRWMADLPDIGEDTPSDSSDESEAEPEDLGPGQAPSHAIMSNNSSSGSAIMSNDSSSGSAERAAPARGNRRGRPRGRADRQAIGKS